MPPLVLFTSDVFHPLVTPLTTYTYTTGGSSTDTVSATDEERLLPGGFSLRQGFPRWFERGDRMSPAAPMFQDIKMPRDKGFGDSSGSGEYSQPEGSDDGARRIKAIHIPPPKDDGLSDDDISPSIIEVLEYVKRVFEVESLLDDLPLDSAGNPGAWHAWRAYRRKSRRAKSPDGVEKRPSTSQRGPDSGGRSKPQNDWNWDGVWVERVKRGINVSLSEAMLFGGSDGDDLVCPLMVDRKERSKLTIPDPLS